MPTSNPQGNNLRTKKYLKYFSPKPILGGVCSSLSQKTNINVNVWRVLFLILSPLPIGLITYCLLCYVFSRKSNQKYVRHGFTNKDDRGFEAEGSSGKMTAPSSPPKPEQKDPTYMSNKSSRSAPLQQNEEKNLDNIQKEIDLLEIELEQKMKSLEEE